MNWGLVVFPLPTTSTYLIGGLTLAAALLLTVLVWRSHRPERRVVRLAASLTAVLALGLIGLRPQLRFPVKGQTAVLLTEGADPSLWRELQSSGRAIERVFSLPGVARDFPAHSQPIPDTAYLRHHFPQITELHLFGYGLDRVSLQSLGPIRIVPHLTPPALGFGSIDWPQQLRLGETLTIQGSLTATPPEGATVVLFDPGEVAHSFVLKGEPRDRFHVRDLPKAAGTYLYRLALKDEKNTVLAEAAIPVQVLPPQSVRILILEAAPNFETKYLKTWLTQTGTGFSIRTRISKALFRWESDRGASSAFERLDSALLRELDLVIADFAELSALDRQERALLENAVISDGLALFVRVSLPPDPDEIAAWPFVWGFDSIPIEGMEERQTLPIFSGADEAALTPLPVEPFHFRHLPLQETLATDPMGRILAAAQTKGLGLVGSSFVAETYRWILGGTPEIHAAYWSHLFSMLIRDAAEGEQWFALSDGPVLADHPTELVLVAYDPDPAATIGRDDGDNGDGRPERLALAQDEWFPRRWTGRWWPVKAGWYRVCNKRGSVFWFFAHEPGGWSSLVQLRRNQATRELVQSANGRQVLPGISVEEIPRLVWFSVFLAAVAVLWVERKWRR